MPVDRATLELFVSARPRARPLRAQLETRSAPQSPTAAHPRTRLPASRVLAESCGVSRGVVSEAYAQIAAEGWIEVRHGARPGRPGSPRPGPAPRQPAGGMRGSTP